MVCSQVSFTVTALSGAKLDEAEKAPGGLLKKFKLESSMATSNMNFFDSGGVAIERTPLPLALANHGCAWRSLALDALDRSGLDYRVAYTSENCAGQEAALLADLAVAPLPLSLVRAPLRSVEAGAGLPAIGEYQVAMVRGANTGSACEVLGGHVIEALQGLR